MTAPTLAEARERIQTGLDCANFNSRLIYSGHGIEVADLKRLLTAYDEIAGLQKVAWKTLAMLNSYGVDEERDDDEFVIIRRELSAFLSTVKPIQGSLRREDAPSAEDPLHDAWQPIETAPRDGTWFVTGMFVDGRDPAYEVGGYNPLYYDKYVEVGGGLYRKEQSAAYEWDGFDNFHRATHWIPLPPAPSVPAKGLGGAERSDCETNPKPTVKTGEGET